MMKFVLVGDIEFIGGTAYVRRVAYGAMLCEGDDIDELNSLGMDYVMPHYYKGRIVFDQFAAYDADEERQQAIQDEYREDELRELAERKERIGY